MQLYYLPGRGGRLETGLGEALTARGLAVSGRETVGEFARMSFQEQIELVAQDLKTNFWHEDSRVIANPFGTHIFLHAQTLLPAYVGKVLLLSLIVGEFSKGDAATGRTALVGKSNNWQVDLGVYWYTVYHAGLAT